MSSGQHSLFLPLTLLCLLSVCPTSLMVSDTPLCSRSDQKRWNHLSLYMWVLYCYTCVSWDSTFSINATEALLTVIIPPVNTDHEKICSTHSVFTTTMGQNPQSNPSWLVSKDWGWSPIVKTGRKQLEVKQILHCRTNQKYFWTALHIGKLTCSSLWSRRGGA